MTPAEHFARAEALLAEAERIEAEADGSVDVVGKVDAARRLTARAQVHATLSSFDTDLHDAVREEAERYDTELRKVTRSRRNELEQLRKLARVAQNVVDGNYDDAPGGRRESGAFKGPLSYLRAALSAVPPPPGDRPPSGDGV